MQSRIVREGSVGLFILLGVGLLGVIILWLRGLQPGVRSYEVVVEFVNTGGTAVGSPVRFRGVNVGKVTAVKPGPNGVAVTAEITPSTVLIPRNTVIEANQSGFVGEVFVDFTPRTNLPPAAIASDLLPFEPNCNPDLILCNGDRLPGRIGISYDALIRSTIRLSEVLGNPELIGNVNRATRNTAIAAGSVDQLAKQTRKELATFSQSANSVTGAANQVNRLAANSGQTVTQVSQDVSQATNRIGNAADQVSSLVQTNRGTLITTLNDLSQTSRELRVATRSLAPALNRIGQGELIQNLETLSANAAQATANLRDFSGAFNNPTNLLVLQQTLDSARVTFQNTQKVTTDLDELTGDPAFRKNLLDLVNGLSKLVSSTQDLEQQVQTAQTLPPIPAQPLAQQNLARPQTQKPIE